MRKPLTYRLYLYLEGLTSKPPYDEAWKTGGNPNLRAKLLWKAYIVSDWLRENDRWHRHEVIDDHCMKPEHRFCVFCGRRQPYAEVSEWS